MDSPEPAGPEPDREAGPPRLGDLHETRREALERRLGDLRARGTDSDLGARLADWARAAAAGLIVALRLFWRGLRWLAALALEGIRALGLLISDTWFSLSVAVRQRLAAGAALLALVALFFLLVIPNAPCAFPGGEQCPPADDAIVLVPADTGAYLHANLDPDTDQFEAAGELAERLPQFAGDAAALLPQLSETETDFERDVRPWSGGEVAVALVGQGLALQRLLLLEAEDTAGALEFATALQGPGLTESELLGVTVRVAEDGLASAIVDGFLVLGTESMVRGTIENAAGPGDETLAADPEAKSALGALPDKRLAEAYLAPELARLAASDGTLGAFNTFVSADTTEGVAAAITVGEDERTLSLAVRSTQDSEAKQKSPFMALPLFEPSLPGSIGSDAYAYLGLGDPAASAQSLVSEAAAVSRPLQRSLESFTRRLGRAGGVDLETQLLPRLGGEAALTVEPKLPQDPAGEGSELEPAPGIDSGLAPPYLALLADEVDADAAREDLAGLQGPIADAIDPAAGQAPVFESFEVEGVQVQSLQISPSVEFSYATFDDKLIVGSSTDAVVRAVGDPESLADSDTYKDAVEGLPEQVSLLLYLDAPELLALGEQVADLPLVPAYARVAGDLRQLESAALAVSGEPDLLSTDLQLSLSEQPVEPAVIPGSAPEGP